MYKAVIFDFDYTLGDSSRGIVLSVNHALTQMGFRELPSEAICPTIGLSLSKTCQLLTGCADAQNAALFTRLFHEKAESVMVPSTTLYPHTLGVLRALRRQGCRTAIVTTKLRQRIEQILTRTGADGLFDLVVGAEDVRAEKPSPEGLLFAIDRMGMQKRDVLYVGDSVVDAQTAQRAGVPFAAVLTGQTPREAFSPYAPSAVCTDLADLNSRLPYPKIKAACIVGSARSDGSCARLIDALIKGLQEGGVQTTRHCVGTSDIRYCKGCKRCYVDGRCVIDDDVPRILADVLDSDIVAIAAPSYWAGVPGQLKTLFDRTTPYGDTNPNRILTAYHPIKGVAIAVRAGTRPQENELILSAISHYFGHLGIKTAKEISVCCVDTPEDLLSRHQDTLRSVYELGRTLADEQRSMTRAPNAP